MLGNISQAYNIIQDFVMELVIEAIILKQKYKNENVLIKRIPLIPNDKPYHLK